MAEQDKVQLMRCLTAFEHEDLVYPVLSFWTLVDFFENRIICRESSPSRIVTLHNQNLKH